MLWSLFSRSAWVQAANVASGTTYEGAALTSIRSFRVFSDSHSGDGQDR
jgi:hypothetical protein